MKDEMSLLISLLEDPDHEIYQRMSQQILAEGEKALPLLEEALLSASSSDHFDRIDKLISEIYFRRLMNRLKDWIYGEKDLLSGITLVTEIIDSEKESEKIIKTLSDLRNEIWVELSSKLTALEKTIIVNHFLFTKANFQIYTPAKDQPKNFSLAKLVSDKSGSEQSVFAAYTIIVRMLGLPIYFVNVPGGSLLAYLDIPITPKAGFKPDQVQTLFFISPIEKGRILGSKELRHYLNDQYPDFNYHDIKAISDLQYVEYYASLIARSCNKSGKQELEAKIRKLLTLWPKP